MEETEQLLGRPFRIEGEVSDGNHIGRKMGVPTANLEPADGKVLPPYGVYAVRVLMNGRVYDAIANLGIKPTVGNDNPVGLEVNLFDTTGDLYGRWLSVSFVSFLRTEQRFDSIESLHAQIEKDIEEAKRRLADGEG